MKLERKDLGIRPRGRRKFETWQAHAAVQSTLGSLPLRILTPLGEEPTEPAIRLAAELGTFVERNGPLLCELIVAHYRLAQVEGWLDFWGVRPGLGREEVLGQVRSVALNVHCSPVLEASIAVDPAWEPEHKLSLAFNGSIHQINGERFTVDRAGVLRLALY